MLAEGDNLWEVATANAMSDPIAIGPGRFHHADEIEEVDTVYLGTFDRQDFLDVGGYRRFPSGTVEDTDFYVRWRAAGFTVIVDPSIRSWYRPRSSWRALARQYLRYGRGKSELLLANGRFPSMRPFAPALLVAGFVGGTAIALVWSWVPLAMLAGLWIAALGVVGVRAPNHRLSTTVAAATMHVAYGCGLWLGVGAGIGRNPSPAAPSDSSPSR
jgi:cellulose synthase/poly-beta-1,6-N-acetylglucosamine synthase-like glycosyltransferase